MNNSAKFIGSLIDIEGSKLRIYQEGTGPDILFIHAHLGVLEDGIPLLSHFRSNFRITLYDRPGIAFSQSNTAYPGVISNVESVYKLIQTLQLKDVVLIGHSYGGTIALGLLSLFPEVVKSILLLAPCLYPHSKFNAAQSVKIVQHPILGHPVFTLLKPILGKFYIERGLKPAISIHPEKFPDNFLSLRKKLLNNSKSLITYASQLTQYNKETKELSEKYHKLNKPIFLLCGNSDIEPIVDGVRRFVKEIGLKDYKFLPNTHHYIQLEDPDEFIKMVNRAVGL